METHSQVQVRMAPCFCGIFLDNVYATVDSSDVDKLLNFEADETVCKRNFNFQYKETSYDNKEIFTRRC